ncbi:hypothetical protein HDZ31DRAFT_44141 [Schizophyllum fasciatum]
MDAPESVAVTETEVDEQSLAAEEDVLDEEETQETAPADDDAPADPKGKKKRKAPAQELEREPGKSLLPFTRVQKIIKADKEIPMVARDATFLISLATEEFIRRFCQAGQRVADREKRTTVQHRDLATVVRKADEFLFLEEIIPWTAPDPAPRRPKAKAAEKPAAQTALDTYVGVQQTSGAAEGADEDDNPAAVGVAGVPAGAPATAPLGTLTHASGDAASDVVMVEDEHGSE